MLKLIKQNFNWLMYGLSLLLIRLPPFWILPGMTSHVLFRVIIFVLLIKLILIDKQKLHINLMTVIMIMFFIYQSVSVVNVVSVDVYIYFYERLITVILFALVSLLLIDKKHNSIIFTLITITVVINIGIELFMYIFPSIINYLYSIIHYSVLDIFVFNLQRNRLYFESYNEALLPVILLFSLTKKKTYVKLFYWLLSTLIILIAFWSNYRDRFIVVGFSLIIYLLVLKKAQLMSFIKHNLILLLLSILILIGGYFHIYKTIGYSVIDRILLQDQKEDIDSLISRGILFDQALTIGQQQPLTGVGLGNFYDHLSFDIKNQRYYSVGQDKKYYEATLFYPHNLIIQTFVETGFIGLFCLLLILTYLAVNDYRILIMDHKTKTPLIIAFWALVLYAMFNPRTYLTFYTNFFILRILINLQSEKQSSRQI